jgi:hypothetical protein
MVKCELFCPNPEMLYPCTCHNGTISCVGNEEYDVKKIFFKLSQSLEANQKSFNRFYFTNKAIKKIEPNTFYDITFESIGLSWPDSLERIHTSAFISCIHTLKSFEYYHWGSSFQETGALIDDPPNYSIFGMLSSFVNVEKVDVRGSLLVSIPENAFRGLQPINGPQDKLKEITLGYGKINTIGKNAFYHLNNLKNLYLGHNKISHIEPNSFCFENSSNAYLKIQIPSNRLNSSSFEIGSFMNTKRPLDLNFWGNNITYLDENVFSPFFQLNSYNSILLKDAPLNCSDCRNYWIIKDKLKLKNKLTQAKCGGNGKSIFDDTISFDHCKFVNTFGKVPNISV